MTIAIIVLVADAGDERWSSCRSSAMPAWRSRSASARLINAVWLFVGLSAAAGTSRRRAGAGFALAVVRRDAADGRRCSGPRSARIDWLGLAGREGLRIGWLAACLAAPRVLYFGVLVAAGLRPRDFSRRG